MVSKLLLKIVTKPVTQAGSKKIEDYYDKAGKTLFGNPDKIEKRFNDELKESISEAAKTSDRKEYIQLLRHWDLVEANLEEFDSYEISGGELLFENKPKIINQMSDILAEIIDVDLDNNPDIASELNSAVEQSFYNTLNYLEEKSEEKRINEELSEFELQLAQQIKTIKESIAQIERKHSWSSAFDVYDLEGRSSDEFANSLSVYLGIDVSVPYIERKSLDGIGNRDKIVIKGRGGSGKSRVLLEYSKEIIDKKNIDKVVLPSNNTLDLDDVRELCNTRFQGNLLLIWDDIHKSYSLSRGSDVFTASVSRIEEKVENEGFNFFLGGSLRSDEIDEIPVYKKPDSIWKEELYEEELEELTPEEINTLITAISKRFEVPITDTARLKLGLKALEADPFPFYIYSVISAATEDETLTEEKIESYSSSAREFWEDHFRNLVSEDDRSKHLLWSLNILETLNISYYISLAYGIYHQVFDQPKFDFYDDLKDLENKGWIQVVDSNIHRNQIIKIHDLQIEAISAGDNKDILELCIGEFSLFLLENLESYLPDYNEWVEPLLQQNFASFAMRFDESKFEDEIEKHFRKSMSADYDVPEVYGNYGRFLGEQGKTKEAEDHFKQAIEENPRVPTLRAQYARFLEERAEGNDIETAEKQFKLAVRLNPPNPEIYKYYGQFLMRREKNIEAKKQFDKAISLGSQEPTVYLAAISIIGLYGDPSDIGEYLHKLVNLPTCGVLGYVHYAVWLQNFGSNKSETPDEYIQKAKEIDPEHPSIALYYVNHNPDLKEHDDLKRRLQKGLEESDEIAYHYGLAQILRDSEKESEREQAITHYEAVLDKNTHPNDNIEFTEIYFALCDLLNEFNKYDKLGQRLSELVNMNPDSGQAHFNYAEFCRKSGRYEEAEEQYWTAFRKMINSEQQGAIGELFSRLLYLSSAGHSRKSQEEWKKKCMKYISRNGGVNTDYYKSVIQSIYMDFSSS